jgi:hypothetical protein
MTIYHYMENNHTDISYNLKIAKSNYLSFLNNLNIKLINNIYFDDIELDGIDIFFKFKNPNMFFNFKIYAGEDLNDNYIKLKENFNHIYNLFINIKK